MFKKITFSILGTSLSILLMFLFSYAQDKTSTTTTTVEEISQIKTPATKAKPVVKPASSSTSVISTTTTTDVVKPPAQEVVRKVYDEETLKKMSATLCTDGFKAFVGTDKKNVCLGRASPPDIAYSCVWDKEGSPAYAPTVQGPCSLDFVEHRGNITIKKETFTDPPLAYGTEAQCCYRAAKGPAVPLAK